MGKMGYLSEIWYRPVGSSSWDIKLKILGDVKGGLGLGPLDLACRVSNWTISFRAGSGVPIYARQRYQSTASIFWAIGLKFGQWIAMVVSVLVSK